MDIARGVVTVALVLTLGWVYLYPREYDGGFQFYSNAGDDDDDDDDE
jgi:hypothetical protein